MKKRIFRAALTAFDTGALLVLLCPIRSYAQAYPQNFSQMLENGQQTAAQFGALTVSDFWAGLWQTLFPDMAELVRLAKAIILYLLAIGAVQMLLEKKPRQYLHPIQVLGLAALVLPSLAALLQSLVSQSEQWERYLLVLIPVFSGLVAAGGYTGTALVYSSTFIGAASLFAAAIRLVLLPMIQVYLAVAAAGAIWHQDAVIDAAKLLMRFIKLCFQGVAVLLGLLLGAQSVLASCSDNLALKTGKALLAGGIPIVGQAASDALGAVLAGLKSVKGYVAFAAVASVLLEFLPVFGRAVFALFSLDIGGILAQALGLEQCQKCLLAFAEGIRLCLTVVTIYFLLLFFATVYMVMAGG